MLLFGHRVDVQRAHAETGDRRHIVLIIADEPLCTPSRVQIMAGIYNSRNDVRFGLLQPGAYTFANLLRDAGCSTKSTARRSTSRHDRMVEQNRKMRTQKHLVEIVAYVNKMVGNVVDALGRSGLREKMLLLFTADNGAFVTTGS